MKKRICVLMTVLLFVFAFPITANASQMRALSVSPTLRFEGTTAHCSTTVIDGNKELIIKMELWHGNALIGSWSSNGKGSVFLQGNCHVIKGQTYELVVTGTANGNPINKVSISRTC